MYRNFFDVATYSNEEMSIIGALLSFDSETYLQKYPDVAAAQVDPLRHFLMDGMYEGRTWWNESGQLSGPSLVGHVRSFRDVIGFDEQFYAARYPDVQEHHFLHFLQFGMMERRQPYNFSDNIEVEALVWAVLGKHPLAENKSFDRQLRVHITNPDQLIQQLLSLVKRKNLYPKPYRNNFWMLLAICFLTKGYFGAAAVCYNFFYNFFLPLSHLRNWQAGIYVAGRCTPTIQYARAYQLPVHVLPAQASRTVPNPVFLNRPNIVEDDVEYMLPPPTYCRLEEVLVIGGNSLMIGQAHEFLYDYLQQDLDESRPAEFKGPNLLHSAGAYCSIKYLHSDIYVEEAFSLLHDHGHNYFHWMVEVLPRYLLARRNGLALHVPVLIDEQIGALQEDVLRHLLGLEAEIIKIPRNTAVRVGKLHWVSDLSINTVHTLHLPEKNDILISPTALQLLRELAEPYFTSGIEKYQKMQIVRHNVEFRRLVNRKVLRTSLSDIGYWGFDPGQETFEMQIRAFSNARIIVGEAGAALANMVFCQSGTIVCILVNGYCNSNYYYLAEMAQSLGLKIVFFECLRLDGTHALGVHDDMIVHVGKLVDNLLALETGQDGKDKKKSIKVRIGNYA